RSSTTRPASISTCIRHSIPAGWHAVSSLKCSESVSRYLTLTQSSQNSQSNSTSAGSACDRIYNRARMRYALALALAISATVVGQQRPDAPRALTAADYARAERFLTYNTTPLVLHSGVRPTWLPDNRFWYRVTTERGSEAVLI